MDKLKLGFTDTHQHLADFFYSILSTRYSIEIDNNSPEFLIFGDDNFGHNNLKFSKKDCIKIFYTGENRRPENYDCHYAISFDHSNMTWHYRLPLFMVYIWAYKNIHNLPYDYDYILKVKRYEKTNFCSFIVSNPNGNFRNTFFDRLNKIKKVDSAGKFLKNTEEDITGFENYFKFISSRKFNLCFENSSYPGYCSEKILNAFYSGTVPIYWGSQTIENDFNSKSFINVMKFKTIDHAIDRILQIDSDNNLYEEILNEKPFVNNIPPNYFYFDNFLNWFDSVVYRKRYYR
jgi:hypothetical protein